MGDDAGSEKARAAGTGTFAPLADPTFRTIWTAVTISNLGALIQLVGAAWMMTELTGSPQLVALVQVANALPPMLLSILAGAVADSFDRRRIMLAAQIFMFAVSVALTVTAFLGGLSPWVLLGCTFLIGCGAAFNNPSYQASVREMAPPGLLASAVGLNALSFNVARSLGPAIGGVLVAAVGAAGAFLANAVSYIGLIIVLLRWKPKQAQESVQQMRERLDAAMGSGLRYVALSPQLRNLIVRAAMASFAGCAMLALMPIVTRDLVGGGSLTYGFVFGAFGLGAIAGSLALPRLRGALNADQIAHITGALMGVSMITAGLSHVLPLTLLAHAVGGACWVVAFANFNVVAQISTPGWVLARALAAYYTVLFGGQALGAWTWGAAAERHTVTIALATAGIVQILFVLGTLRMPLPRGDLDVTLHGAWREPRGALPMQSNSGPIAVTVEYRIVEEDVPIFLRLMNERRRIRRRDGARDWSLAQDVEDPVLWLERYQTPTWADYVRLQQRVTRADQIIGDRIKALHRADGFVVHRMLEQPPAPQGDIDTPRGEAPRDANI